MIHVGDIMSTVGGVQYCGGTQIAKDIAHPLRYCTHVIHGGS